MATETNKIINELNFYKYTKLIVETCTRTMLIAYRFLYHWPDKLPHKLADHLNQIPANQVKILKDLFKGPGDIAKIRSMIANEDEMKAFDITFFYKLIQYATNNDKIKSPYDSVWTRNCPQISENELEHLLFLVKNDRNEFSHNANKFLNLKDEDIIFFCDILRQRLPSIIRISGTIAGVDQIEIDEICVEVIDEIEVIRVVKEISSCDEKLILKIMVEKDLLPKLQELKRCFSEELKNYCPPNFKILYGNKTMSTEELLSDGDLQLICINAEAGFGKTSFTKYVQRELLLEIEKNSGDDLASREIPIRIACRNITGRNVSEFLEDEIPMSRHYASNTSSLKNFLERFDIRWIIDGYDERTGEFYGFFESLLKTLASNHKIIITSRPYSLINIKKQLKNMKICDVSIECFADHQIIGVAEKYFEQAIDCALFIHFIITANNETLKFMKIPINLTLCLELWTDDPTIFYGKLPSIYQLYDMILDKQIDLLVSRHKGKTNVTSEEDLKIGIIMWFSYLCEIVAESAFSYDLSISESQKVKLTEKATLYGLLGVYCLSTFFNFDKSCHRTNYFIKHKTQKEFLVCVYLKNCDNEALKNVVQQDEIAGLVEKYVFNGFRFLSECCNKCEFAKIFVRLLEVYPKIARYLLQIKNEKKDYLDILKKVIKELRPSLMICVDKDYYNGDLMKIVQYLMTDDNSFKIIVTAETRIRVHEEINDIISNCNGRNSFNLTLKIHLNKFVPTIQMYTKHGNINVIKELYFEYYYPEDQRIQWNKELIKVFFKLQNLENASFLDGWSIFHFAISVNEPLSPLPLTSHLNPFQTPSSTINSVPLAIPSSNSLSHFKQSCHAQFRDLQVTDLSEMIENILVVNNMFRSISINLMLFDDYLTCDLNINVLERFLSSSILVKELCIIEFENLYKYPNAMQLVNYDGVESLVIEFFHDSLKSQSITTADTKYFIDICNFDKLKKLKEIELYIVGKSSLNLIFNKFPSDLWSKTTLRCRRIFTGIEIIVDDIKHKEKFKKIMIHPANIPRSLLAQLRNCIKALSS